MDKINLELSDEELKKLIGCCIFETMERELARSMDTILENIKKNILNNAASDIEENISCYQKEAIDFAVKHERDIERNVEEFNTYTEMNENRMDSSKKVIFNMSEKKTLEKLNEFKDSDKNNYRLNLGEIIEMGTLIYMEHRKK